MRLPPHSSFFILDFYILTASIGRDVINDVVPVESLVTIKSPMRMVIVGFLRPCWHMKCSSSIYVPTPSPIIILSLSIFIELHIARGRSLCLAVNMLKVVTGSQNACPQTGEVGTKSYGLYS